MDVIVLYHITNMANLCHSGLNVIMICKLFVAFVALKHPGFHADVCMILPLRSLWEY